MKVKRLYHSIRLLFCRTARKRAQYLKENNVLLNIAQGIKLAFTVIISVIMLLIEKIHELYKAISEIV